MATQERRKIEAIAKDRGWKILRRGGHEQLIMEYPGSGARFTIGCTPRSTPNLQQITKKMVNLERSSRARIVEECLDWWCKQEGIAPEGSGEVRVNITNLAIEFCKANGYAVDRVDSVKSGLANSDRLWYVGRAVRGISANANPAPRLLFGRTHIMRADERTRVLQYAQTNGGGARQSEITKALQAIEIDRQRATEVEEPTSDVVAETTGPDPFPKEPDLLEQLADAEAEVVALGGEIGVGVGAITSHMRHEAPTNGHRTMPAELEAALRAFYASDSSEIDTAIQMASEALDAAENAVREARAALALAVQVKN